MRETSDGPEPDTPYSGTGGVTVARCTECGAAIKAGSRSCEYCGARVDLGALESVLGFVEDRLKERERAAKAAREAKAERERIEAARRPKVLMVSDLVFVVCMLVLGVLACNENANTVAMPTSASDLKGENYQDVVTRLKAAGFASIETTPIDDLIIGFLKKDGEVERVSVDGTTDFEANSRFPKGARIVVTYHTFPEEAPETAEESSTAGAETTKVVTPEVDSTVLTAANNEELKAVLKTDDPGGPEVPGFIQKYAGRTIEFDGYTWDWLVDSGTTNIYVGDVQNANESSKGPIFRVEGYRTPDSSSPPARKNVHVKAVVDDWDDDHTFFRITLVSLEPR